MGFIGSINDKLKKFFYTHAKILEGRKCYIGCSGNFTIEQIISRRCNEVEIYSNDVSLYSSVLGYMLTNKSLYFEITNSELIWANNYAKRGSAEAIATLLLLLEMFKYEKQKNDFSIRMWQTYLLNFDDIFKKTLEKVKKASEHIQIKEYTMIDVYDYYPRRDGVSIGFLPTYVGGYEKLFSRLEESIRWDKPRYEMLTADRREETINRMIQGDYILYDDLERNLPCVARVEQFGKKVVYIYSNLNFRKGIFRKQITEKIINYNMLMSNQDIPDNSEIFIKQVDIPTINHYRNMFLSKKIQPGSGDPCYLVFADDKLFGFLIFQTYSKRGGDPDQIYLLSDFVVPSNRYKRLAKLLLMVSLCKETRQALNQKLIKDYTSILTTAFTDKPVSMKYRGVFELVKRGKGFLNYAGQFNDMNYKEVISKWKKKYEKQAKTSLS